jgi:hypothetical protein
MLAPTAILLLASYVGPTASPDANPNAAPSTYQAGTGIESKNTEAKQPTRQKQTNDDDMNPDDIASEPEQAEEGHLVVPPGLQ